MTSAATGGRVEWHGPNRIDAVASDAPALAGAGALPVGVRTLTVINPDQVDLADPAMPRRDRRLVTELWYPCTAPGEGGFYETLLRDGVTPIRLWGRAQRDAEILPADWPLVILSHGYPGNRMLLAHFAEALASRGYLVASIDHPNSTYQDKGAFIDTLVHRPLDTRCVADHLAADRYAIIGYSMGGYGALVAGGAGVSEAALTREAYGGPVLVQHRTVTPDPRLKAIVPIGPWGRQAGIWDAQGLGRLRVTALIMAGSADTISGYDSGMRLIFAEAGAPCHLLTFEGAGHNAAAPIPAPDEAWQMSPHLDFLPAEHYADPVWNTLAMNGIAQHFVAAFLGLHLQGDATMADYLAPGWKGFAASATAGLRWESRSA